MAKKSTTKVYGFKATPMREQFKRERELLMRQMRRYERKGFTFDATVQVPAKERAGQRITKSYIAKLQALRKSIPSLAYRVTDEAGTKETAKQYTHWRRGEYAQQQKTLKATERIAAELDEEIANLKLLRETNRALYGDWEAELAPPEPPAPPEPLAPPEPPAQTEPGYERPELPDIAHVIVDNFLSMFEEYAENPAAQGAQMMVDAIERMVAGHGYRDTAKALDEHMGAYPINDVAYSVQLANAVITSLLHELTGEDLDEFESDGGYWPGDDLYE